MLYQLAELNVGRIRGVKMDDPIMKEFVDNLDRINTLAESSEGFVWRLKDDNNNATSFRPFEDERIAVNLSVWQDIESLENYVFNSGHVDYVRRRKEWFEIYGKAYVVLWWVPNGYIPSLEEAISKLDYLQDNGPTELAFTFRHRFAPPKRASIN